MSARLGTIAPMRPTYAGAVLVLLLAGSTATAGADSLRVTRTASPGTRGFALEVRLDDPRRLPSEGAWVAVGEERGVQAERRLALRLLVDPSGIALTAGTKVARLGFLTLARAAGDETGLLQLALEWTDAGWQVVPRVRDDAQGTLVTLGRTPLALDGAHGVALEVEWRAASAPGARDGVFALYRGGSTPDAPRTLLVGREDLDNATQAVGQVRLGVAASEHSPGVAGVLRLDEFELYREAAPAARADR